MVLIFRPTPKLGQLESKIREMDLSSRAGFTNRALKEAEHVTDWKLVRDELLNLESKEISVPASMNIAIEDDELCERVREKIRVDLDLVRLTTPYFVTLLYQNYLSELKTEKIRVGTKFETEDLSAPDMVARLVEMLLLNREEDRETLTKIKSILLNWQK